jgi:predicted enzyme related to lactoylglutathione lyase
MENIAVWFEIPVKEMDRARKFYNEILEIDIQVQELMGALMGFFPMEGYASSGSLVQGEGFEPCDGGTFVYLNGGEDLTGVLDRVEPAGGKVVIPKTPVDEESGFFARFTDTEGNTVGLWSPK